MKTYNLNLKALILILVLTLTGQSYAHRNFALADEKKVVKVNMKAPLIKFITNTLEITSDDLENLKVQLREANFFLINNDNMELQLTLIDSENSDSFLFIEYGNDDNKLEDWMFEDDYLSSETAPAIEDWMFEDDYLSS